MDERLVRYLDVADVDEAASLLNALDGASDSRRLIQVLLRGEAPASFQRQLARQFSEGDINAADARTALRRIDETGDPAVRNGLYRTVSEGGANGARLLARTDNLDAVKRLMSDPEVGDDARTLIRRFDDQETLEQFFELDVSRADEVREDIAQFFKEPLFSQSQAEQFVRDVQRLKQDGEFVDGFENGPVADIADAGQASDLRGAAFETRVASTYGPNQIRRVAFEVKRSDGSPLTEVDIELKNGDIVEVKSSLSRQGEDLEQKVGRLAQSGELTDGETYVIRSTESPSSALRQRIDTVETDLNEQGINVNIEFEQTSRIESS